MKLLGEFVTEGLTPAHKIAFVNSKQKKIKDFNISDAEKEDIDLFAECGIILGTCYEIFSQTAPGETEQERQQNLYATTQLLYCELTKYFTTYTTAEILEAVKMGYCGHLEPLKSLSYPLVSVANITKIVQWYNEKVRSEAIHAQNKLQEAEKNRRELEKTEEKNKQARIITAKNINNVYRYFIENGVFPFVGGIEITVYERALWYIFIEKIGLSKLSLEEKHQIKALAEGRIADFDELSKEEKYKLSFPGRREEWEAKRKSEVLNEARSIALQSVFVNSKDEKIEILINENLLNLN